MDADLDRLLRARLTDRLRLREPDLLLDRLLAAELLLACELADRDRERLLADLSDPSLRADRLLAADLPLRTDLLLAADRSLPADPLRERSLLDLLLAAEPLRDLLLAADLSLLSLRAERSLFADRSLLADRSDLLLPWELAEPERDLLAGDLDFEREREREEAREEFLELCSASDVPRGSR